MPTDVIVLSNRLPSIISRLGAELDDAVQESARGIASRVTVGMAEAKSGRWYGQHQASAPGEMPAIDTGNLATIKAEREDLAHWVVYTEAEYAAHLEFGTESMSARPFFTPAATEEGETFSERVRGLEARL
jgi:phage gpG-like protein